MNNIIWNDVFNISQQALAEMKNLYAEAEKGKEVPIYRFLTIISTQISILTSAITILSGKNIICGGDIKSAVCGSKKNVNPIKEKREK